MASLSSLFFAIVALLGAAFAKLLADEFKAWAPSIVDSILALAVGLLPLRSRERFAEEWPSHLNDLPGDLSKVLFACGCILAACKMNAAFAARARDIAVAGFVIAFLAPVLAVIAIAIKFDSQGPVLNRRRLLGRHGKPFVAYAFRIVGPDGSFTALGRLLYYSWFDELPLLFNVLRGDATMVGPRVLDKERESHQSERPSLTPLPLLKAFFKIMFRKRTPPFTHGKKD